MLRVEDVPSIFASVAPIMARKIKKRLVRHVGAADSHSSFHLGIQHCVLPSPPSVVATVQWQLN